MTALMNQWCGPVASPMDGFMHSFLEFEDFFSCEWCGEQMSHIEAQEWVGKYAVKLEQVVRKGGRREGGT